MGASQARERNPAARQVPRLAHASRAIGRRYRPLAPYPQRTLRCEAPLPPAAPHLRSRAFHPNSRSTNCRQCRGRWRCDPWPGDNLLLDRRRKHQVPGLARSRRSGVLTRPGGRIAHLPRYPSPVSCRGDRERYRSRRSSQESVLPRPLLQSHASPHAIEDRVHARWGFVADGLPRFLPRTLLLRLLRPNDIPGHPCLERARFDRQPLCRRP